MAGGGGGDDGGGGGDKQIDSQTDRQRGIQTDRRTDL